jgi:zona occludens toxin
MTVSLYEGPVGSGKSYHAFAEGLMHIAMRRPRYVYTNIPLVKNKDPKKAKMEQERWFFDSGEITPEKLIRFAVEKKLPPRLGGFEGKCKLIIDESPTYFEAREWTKKDRKSWLRFLAHSRKLGFDVILVAQDQVQVDKQIRKSVEYFVRHYNINRYWWFSWLPIKIFWAVHFWAKTNTKGTVQTILFRKKLAKRYDSWEVFDEEMRLLLAEAELEAQEAALRPAPAQPAARPTAKRKSSWRRWLKKEAS